MPEHSHDLTDLILLSYLKERGGSGLIVAVSQFICGVECINSSRSMSIARREAHVAEKCPCQARFCRGNPPIRFGPCGIQYDEDVRSVTSRRSPRSFPRPVSDLPENSPCELGCRQ